MRLRVSNHLLTLSAVLCLGLASIFLCGIGSSQDKPIILFDDAVSVHGLERLLSLEAKRYFIVYQDEADSEAKHSGRIRTELLIAKIGQTVTRESEGWGVLDFEFPFEDWLQRPSDTNEHQTAEREMIKAIRAVKACYPKIRWTYWGIPSLPFYVEGTTWNLISDTRAKAIVSERLALYKNVLSECDWLGPCVYVTVGDESLGGVPTDAQQKAIRAWTLCRVKMAVDFYSGSGWDRPVLPFVSPLYMPGGGARSLGVIAPQEVRTETLEPTRAAGAQGVAIWTAASFFLRQAFEGAAGLKEFGGPDAVIRRWRQDLKLNADIAPVELRGATQALLSNAVIDYAKSVHEVWTQTPAKSLR